MKIHSICKTKLAQEQGESPKGYFWWYCPKCKKRIPNPEVIMENKNGR